MMFQYTRQVSQIQYPFPTLQNYKKYHSLKIGFYVNNKFWHYLYQPEAKNILEIENRGLFQMIF